MALLNPALAIALCVPFMFLLFVLYPPRVAAIAGVMLSFILLPMWGMKISGLFTLDKMTVPVLTVLLCTAIFDFDAYLKLRPNLLDIPMVLACVAPLFS